MIQLHFLLSGLCSALVIAVPNITPAISQVGVKVTESSVTNTEQKSNGSQHLFISPVRVERRVNEKPPAVKLDQKLTESRSTSSSSGERPKKSKSGSNKESLELSQSSGSSSSSESKEHKTKTTKKSKDPVSTVERHGWRKWHRKCYSCPEDMKMKWRDPRIKWICGGYQRARRSFKSECLMHYRNCQDGTMFVKLHDKRCTNDTGMDSQPHGEHFMYEYDVKLSDDTSDSRSSDSGSSDSSSSSGSKG